MPDSHFNIDTTSPEDLRHEAEELDDVAEALRRCADRGHFSKSPHGRGGGLIAALLDRANELRAIAAIKAAKPINKVAT